MMEEKFWEYKMWSHQTGCWTLGEQREENDDDDDDDGEDRFRHVSRP